MSTRSMLPFAVFVTLGTLSTWAGATTVYQLDTPALVQGSSDIVVGRVESTRSYMGEDRKHIFTDVTVTVTDRFKGGAGTQIRLTQLGGEVDGIRYTVPGSPLFNPGEETLLFVWRDAHGSAQVNGLAQGKFDITRDPDTGERFVQRTIPGMAVRDARTLELAAKGQPPPRIRLSTMVREIRRAVAAEDQ